MRIARSFKHYTDGRAIYLTFVCKYFYLLRLNAEPHTREVHVHSAGTFVGTAQDQLFTASEQQFTGNGINPVINGRNRYRLTRLETIQVLELVIR